MTNMVVVPYKLILAVKPSISKLYSIPQVGFPQKGEIEQIVKDAQRRGTGVRESNGDGEREHCVGQLN